MRIALLADAHGNADALKAVLAAEPKTARYVLLQWDGGWEIYFRCIQYDVERAVSRLLASERPYRLWIVERLRRAAYVPLATLN